MKKITMFLGSIAVAAVFSSCSMTVPLSASEAPIGLKTGKSSTGIIFGVWELNKNYGVAEAAKNGAIQKGVATVDVQYTNYIVFQKKTIIVQGN